MTATHPHATHPHTAHPASVSPPPPLPTTHTKQDGTSFLNIPFWSDNTTELYSVTLVSGPCNPVSAQSSTTVEDLVAFYPEQPGCNVRVATNSTLVPVLLRDATINTTQPLLVRIATNISLGLERPIVIRRPVLLLGTSSAPVSVDLGMVVNQLDVSAPIAQLAWQAVVLENLAPGAVEEAWGHGGQE